MDSGENRNSREKAQKAQKRREAPDEFSPAPDRRGVVFRVVAHQRIDAWNLVRYDVWKDATP